MPNFSFIERIKKHAPLLFSLLLTAPVVFFQSFRYSFPLGYAGMFTMIAEKINEANFVLPTSLPHYGPGGIPLVYPPLAMYIFALAMRLGIPFWAYLRLVPAIFSLLSVIPLFYLTHAFVKSKTASVIATILIMTSPEIYYTHVWSAGVVRALALCFCLTGILFFIRSIREFSWTDFTLSGVIFSLMLATHWLYAVFATLVVIAILISDLKLNHIRISAGILCVALAVLMPWLFVIIERHGISSILAAYSSHGNVAFIHSMRKVHTATQLIIENLGYVTSNKFLTLLALPGLVILILRKEFPIPLAFFMTFLMGENYLSTIILAGMMAGFFSAKILTYRSEKRISKHPRFSFIVLLCLNITVIIMVILSAVRGLTEIARYEPELDSDSLETATFVRNNTPADASYLFVGKINEAEWFPYLFNRTPVFALWGSEWKGTYDQQTNILISMRECELQKSWSCIENIQKEQNVTPSLLVVPNKPWLKEQIKQTHVWKLIYTNTRHLVWERASKINMPYQSKPYCRVY